MRTKTPKLGTSLIFAAIGGLVLAACSSGSSTGAPGAEYDMADGATTKMDVSRRDGYLYDGEEPIEDPRADTGEPFDEFFKKYGANPFVDTEDDKLSTFAVDVDTGSYTKCRDYLNRGYMPPDEAPRVEEFVNFFDYGYDAPRDNAFAIDMDIAPSRYGQDLKNCHLLRIGMQAKRIDPLERKPAVLTFVIDVSGSMDMENRLGLVKRALKLLVNQMTERDRIGIAVYGDSGYKILDHTVATETETILSAITRLTPQGSTYAEEGIRVGYQMAADSFREGYINRVILCSDGVANVGVTDHNKILETIAENRRKGITLSTIGFGMSNYNDTLMEQLGDKGDGHYAYVDSIEEAKRVFVDNLTGTLQVVARDTKVQVEFNPKVVKSYRLLGYENRDVADKDFRNDSVDGGEVGSGHSVTALYEVKLFEDVSGAICTATMRWKHDEKQEFIELNQEIFVKDIALSWEEAPTSLRLAANVAEFAELMKKSYWAKKGSYDELLKDTKSLINETDDTSVLELATLITKARDLSKESAGTAGGE